MSYSLKDQYFSPDVVHRLSALGKQHIPGFVDTEFISNCLCDWDALELKERIDKAARSFRAAAPVSSLQLLDATEMIAPKFTGFSGVIIPEIVGQLSPHHWRECMLALRNITQYSTSEFAIRPFIVHDMDAALAEMRGWTQDNNEHVRRLASEGCRPRLPWAPALVELKRDPTPILPIISALSNDASDYVRRSAANNLNDISKDNPEIAIATATQWLKSGAVWAARHGMRTLLKKGDAQVLPMFGYDAVDLAQSSLTLSAPSVVMGQSLECAIRLTLRRIQKLRVEIGVHYKRGNGWNEKKFMVLDKTPTELTLSLSKALSFAPLSTRKYYPGPHRVELYVNGLSVGSYEFEVTK